ncbi:MAG: hypothetical protein AAFV07_15605 [Bacteroidota bacterium]
MHIHWTYRFLLLAGCLLAFSLASAQRGQQVPQIGLGATAITYAGDFTDPETQFQRVYPGFDLILRSAQDRRFASQLTLGTGRFVEQFDGNVPPTPPDVELPDFVDTRFLYGDLRVYYHPVPEFVVDPFIGVGAGLIYFTPRDKDGRLLTRNSATRAEGERYNPIIPQLPIQGGVRFRLNDFLKLGTAYTYRFVPSDYLDNIGNLGTRSGFDALHAVQLTLWVNLGTP